MNAALRMALICGVCAIWGCERSMQPPQRSLAERAARRAFPGAPPVIPHAPQSSRCVACHSTTGMIVPVLGAAPPNPHTRTAGMSEKSRCTQCHVFRTARDAFAATDFAADANRPRRGERTHPLAPPTIPHPLFMREDCLACHVGAAAPAEIVCRHPERVRCAQCHVSQDDLAGSIGEFAAAAP